MPRSARASLVLVPEGQQVETVTLGSGREERGQQLDAVTVRGGITSGSTDQTDTPTLYDGVEEVEELESAVFHKAVEAPALDQTPPHPATL